MEAILNKIFNHYLDHSELLIKEKEILSLKDLVLCDYIGRKVRLYCNKNSFIKLDYRKINLEKNLLDVKSNNKCNSFIFKLPVCLNNNLLLLDKFPKEIIITNIIRKELPNNIIKIKNYYFSNQEQILLMEHAGITFKDFIINNINNYDAINTKVYELFIIYCLVLFSFKNTIKYNSFYDILSFIKTHSVSLIFK